MLLDPENLLPALDWRMRVMSRRVSKAFRAQTGRGLRVRSGLRSCEEQNRIYAQGRTTPGAIVTGAPGCRSWHVSGRAIDVDPFDPDTGRVEPNGNHNDYRILGALWKAAGGHWGGDFANLYDPGHLEWHADAHMDDVCPLNTPCSAFRVANATPSWVWFGGILLAGSLATGLVWALRR